MCKRNTTDPLVRTFLDKFGLTLLLIPRERAAVGDLYVKQRNRILPPGQIGDFLQPAITLPPAKHEALAQLSGVLSQKVSFSIGIEFLEGFLSVLGAFPLVDSARFQYQRSGVESLSFRLTDCTRTFVDLVTMGTRLSGRRPDTTHPLWRKGSRYYVTVAVVRSPSLNVRAERSDGSAPKIDISALHVAGASASVSVHQTGAAELKYQGKRQLAIGVEVVELLFDHAGGLRFGAQKNALALRDDAPPPRTFLGDDDNAFVLVDDVPPTATIADTDT
jgi:hypothetical protein